VVVGQLHQRAWTAEDGTARSVVEVVADRAVAQLALGDGDHDQDDADPSK
jgi:single-stranded DNA-binding protein